MPVPEQVNKYAKRSRISEARFRQLLRCFCLDLDATQTAELTRLNRNTVNRYLGLLRRRIAGVCEQESWLAGEVEVDESYFGARRVRGRRGRGAGGKTPVFGIFERGGRVYTQVVPDCSRARLQALIRGRVSLDSVIHSDGWAGYDGLVDLGYKKHFRVRHAQGEYARGRNHINGIESFWSFAKTRLAKFRGVRGPSFTLHLKECEFRFNHRSHDLYATLLKLLRKNPLN